MEDWKKWTKMDHFMFWGFFCYPKKITSKNPFFFNYEKLSILHKDTKNVILEFTA